MIAKAIVRRSPSLQKSINGREQAPQQTNSYLSAKCLVRRVAEKGGYAVFAGQHIRKGELLVVWSGTLVDEATLATLPASVRSHTLQVEEDHYLVSLTASEPADYVNHSCNPNAGLSGQIALVSMRDIEPGEEITYDYAMSDGSGYDEFECKCGAPQCRHWVGSMDWKIRELWAKYEGFYSPYLASRIAKYALSHKGETAVVRATAFCEMQNSLASR